MGAVWGCPCSSSQSSAQLFCLSLQPCRLAQPSLQLADTHGCPVQEVSNRPDSYAVADAQAKLAVNTKALSDLSFSFHYKVSRVSDSLLHVSVHTDLTSAYRSGCWCVPLHDSISACWKQSSDAGFLLDALLV